jgi:glutaredoxin
MMYTIYTKDNCSWCVKAKELMDHLGIQYTEYKLGVDYTREELREKMGVNESFPLTVPQIFVYSRRIGGFEEFAEYCEETGIMGLQE